MTSEPESTALLLTTCGVLLGVSVVFSRASQRTGVPIALLFILVGMLAGSEGLGHIAFDDYHFAFRFGTIALALILFDGGLNTPLSAVRKAAAPAGVLATVGVAGTALLMAAGRPLARARLAGGAAARCRGVLHRCRGRLLGAPRQRPAAEAAGGRHPGSRIGHQRPGGGHPHHRAHRQSASAGLGGGSADSRSRSCFSSSSAPPLAPAPVMADGICCRGSACRPVASIR